MRQSLLLQDTTYVYDEAGHHLGKYLGIGNKNPGEEVIYLDDMPIAMTIGGVLSYLETDHLGTPRVAARLMIKRCPFRMFKPTLTIASAYF